MRDVILTMSMSLDGFVCGPNGELDWIFGRDPEAKAWKLERAYDASLHVMGSRTFRDMSSYWPTSTDVFAPPMNEIPKAVFTRRGLALAKPVAKDERALAPGAESWGEAYVASGELADEIAALRAHDGKPIRAHGGAGFARSLIAHDLVDEYALLVHPVVLGTGLPIFSDVAALRRLRLVCATAFPGGTLATIYRRV